MRFKMTFKVTLHVLLGIAVLFIAIIPARMVSGIFSQDTTIFIISLSGFIALLALLPCWNMSCGVSSTDHRWCMIH